MRKIQSKVSMLLLCCLLILAMFLILNICTTNNIANAEEKVYSTTTTEEDFADDTIIVSLTNQASISEHKYTKYDFLDINCVDVEEKSFGKKNNAKYNKICVLKIGNPGKQNVLDAIKILEKRNDIQGASVNHYLNPKSTSSTIEPNDEKYLENKQWYLDKIQAQDAWEINTGSANVKVGIIDAGIQGNHTDLDDRIDESLSRTYMMEVEETWPSPLEDNYQINGHGTVIAGIIGAETNNTAGIAGICHNVTLVSLRVYAGGPRYSVINFVEQIEYADWTGIDILNISFTETMMSDNVGFTAAINNYEGLVVCSVDNFGLDVDIIRTDPNTGNMGYIFPAYLSHLPNVISVGNSTSSDEKASKSDYGDEKVSLFAPGTSIYSTTRNGSYGYNTGTSFAAPMVAGVAALIKSEYPNMSAADIKTRILENVDYVPALANLCTSGGRLNAVKALHNHTQYTYTSIGASSHRKICVGCGYTVDEFHDLRYTLKRTYCLFCDYDIDLLGPPIDIRPDKKDDGKCC